MKVLVLGGCGFIGSYVVDSLLEAGHQVRVFDRQPERFRDPLPGVEYFFGNFGDRMAVIDVLSGMDAVVHLISTTFPGTADLDPITDVKDNLVGTLTLLESMTVLNISRILFLSSGGTIYGAPDVVPIPEDHPLRPINSYGIVKASIEHYLDMYRRTRGLLPISIRASNPYGPRQGHSGVQGVIGTFLRRIVNGESLEIWGDGSVIRDYLHASDLGRLCAKAVATDLTGSYNAGSGHGTSLSEIVAYMESLSTQSTPVTYRPGRPIDVQRSILDVSRAKRDLDWQTQIDLKDGIKGTYEWMRSITQIQN
ncbi:NAD-dependent epimerase/dehydratase family protein [Meridianimarinicoccus aquatilis]|uniref:UDP-glucose 4-epimerase n=1 Tax=Meridianimarinicoccus aquatilis TaxID=2552766 RepID=A0A4R6B4M2_9RHOB|nr:NAD-dependent epimerase/dehydratase family protein [Fluviibacterium aquatile]TDL90438.1 NAD-dependent epimerase/dehydratase family protein [Fluviibacterium aquatile]